MPTDLEVLRCRPEPARIAINGLVARHPEVGVAGLGTDLSVSIASFKGVARLSLFPQSVHVSGRWTPVVAWVAAGIGAAVAGSRTVDRATGRPLTEAPTWAEVEALVRAAELARDGVVVPVPPTSPEAAAAFIAQLEAQALLEVGAGREALAVAVAAVLDAPPKGKAAALEALLLCHPAVGELFADRATLQRLIDARS